MERFVQGNLYFLYIYIYLVTNITDVRDCNITNSLHNPRITRNITTEKTEAVEEESRQQLDRTKLALFVVKKSDDEFSLICITHNLLIN